MQICFTIYAIRKDQLFTELRNKLWSKVINTTCMHYVNVRLHRCYADVYIQNYQHEPLQTYRTTENVVLTKKGKCCHIGIS